MIFWRRSRRPAGHAADGYSRITFKPGVAVVTDPSQYVAVIAELERMLDPDEPAAIPPRVFDLTREASDLGLELDLTPARPVMMQAVGLALAAVELEPSAARVADAVRLIEGARQLGARFGLWATQNRFFDIWRARPEARERLAPLGTVLGFDLTPEPR